MSLSRVRGGSRERFLSLVALLCVIAFVCGTLVAQDKILIVEGHFQRAKLLMKKRLFDKAAEQLRIATRIEGNGSKRLARITAGCHMLLVDCLYRAGKYDEGLKVGLSALRKPVFKRPSKFKAELLKLIGKLYEKKGNVDKALQYNERFLKMRSSLSKKSHRRRSVKPRK